MGDTENKELKALQEEERKRVEAEAEAAAAARLAADAKELEDLQASHAAQTEALSSYNNAQYANMGQIMSDLQSKVDAATQKDEAARKRENAFRYISGLGDTLSSFANLVGVTKGAANQQQKYNSHAVVEKAEAARKARKIEMDDLSKRLDEMKARQKELKAAGSLKEAELAAANAKEVAALKATQRKAADEAKYKERQMKVDEQNAKSAAIRAEAYEYSKENPTPRATTAKPKYRQILGTDGKMISFDVSKFDDFEGDYQKALNAAITKGTSGLAEEDIKAYNEAKALAKLKGKDGDGGRALKNFFETHTPRQAIVEAMVQNPIFGSL